MLQNRWLFFVLAALFVSTSGCGLAAYRGQSMAAHHQNHLAGTTHDPILPRQDPVLSSTQQDWLTSESSQAWSPMKLTSPTHLTAEFIPNQLLLEFDQPIQVMSIRGTGSFNLIEHELNARSLLLSVSPAESQRFWGGLCITVAGVLGGEVLVRVQYAAGDSNADGVIDNLDFQDFVHAYNEVLVTAPAQARFDFDRNGIVDHLDYEVFVGAYNAVTYAMTDPCAGE